ncbi:uncharacterized protein [Medicago truncatula]|uniref:uncharacterized protein n=1 Tax=Medicago truncatula TaxID=3880 RepID=UPI000D2F4033|nr:uncharacterized protein LOC112420403 [Medicago truncatula]
MTLVFVGLGQFDIIVKYRFGKEIKVPPFDPPMKFVIDKAFVQPTFDNTLPPFTANLSYRHDNNNFRFDFPNALTECDVTKGYLMLLYEGFVEHTLDKASTSLKLVDDCGNMWECILILGSAPYEHNRIDGEWKRFVDARNLCDGVKIRLGAPTTGKNDTLYIAVSWS